MRFRLLLVLLVTAALGSAAGCTGPVPIGNGFASHPVSSARVKSPLPAPSPSPGATYTGSCNYTLSDNAYQPDWLVGEIDLTSTGNIGVVVRVKITWPQQGYPPVVARKTVRVPYAARVPVRFQVDAGTIAGGSNVIALLQAWQTDHNYATGCTYHAVIIGKFGPAYAG
jgi:hypothetical protein